MVITFAIKFWLDLRYLLPVRRCWDMLGCEAEPKRIACWLLEFHYKLVEATSSTMVCWGVYGGFLINGLTLTMFVVPLAMAKMGIAGYEICPQWIIPPNTSWPHEIMGCSPKKPDDVFRIIFARCCSSGVPSFRHKIFKRAKDQVDLWAIFSPKTGEPCQLRPFHISDRCEACVFLISKHHVLMLKAC